MHTKLFRRITKNTHRTALAILAAVVLIGLAGASCSKKNKNGLPDNFATLPPEGQMAYLIESMPLDSVARFICETAMGKAGDARIELQPAVEYAFGNLPEDSAAVFWNALMAYKLELPLNEQVRLTKLMGFEDMEQYGYDLGLSYVGEIRVEQKDINTISEELSSLQQECKSDPEFYKRFMKGFKTALEYDRHHDLDDKIYLKFISYPDSLK